MSLIGTEMYEFAKALFPLCRSITGEGVRDTLSLVQKHLPHLQIHELSTGTQCFDWTIPDEWRIRDAYIELADGRRVAEFRRNNLHVVNYSTAVDGVFTKAELAPRIHTLPNTPDWIPYVTSYFKRDWGFCMPSNEWNDIPEDARLHAYIDAEHFPGALTYADLVIPGKSKQEILISTYTCHPSMANNEVSGLVLATFLARELAKQEHRYTIRIVFAPETIGAVAYLSRNLAHLQAHVVAGFQLTCVGDNRAYSYLSSRTGDTLADRVIRHVLKHKAPSHQTYGFLRRGSDERQYCAPQVNLPVACLMRTKHGEYPEYHTSADDLSVVSVEGFAGAFDLHWECLTILNDNYRWITQTIGEPMLSKYDLRDSFGGGKLTKLFAQVSNVLAFSDGTGDVIELAEKLGVYAGELREVTSMLHRIGLLGASEYPIA